MKKIRTAILGQGRSGRFIHADYLHKLDSERFELTAICDTEKERQNYAASTFGCDAYPSYKDILKRNDIDLIVNALPNNMHVSVNLEFLNKGVNVFSDKPAAKSVAEIEALISAARENNTVYAVFQSLRFEPLFQKAAEVVNSGVLGRVVSIRIASGGFIRRNDFQSLIKNDGGALMVTCCHTLDQLLSLHPFTETPNVLCHMDRVNTAGDADDYCVIVLKAKGAPLCTVEGSYCNAVGPHRCMLIEAQHGTLMINNDTLTYKYFDPAKTPPRELVDGPVPYQNGRPYYCWEQLDWHEETYSSENTGSEHALTRGAYDAIYKTLTEGKPFPVTQGELIMQMAIIEECRKQNGWIYCKPNNL